MPDRNELMRRRACHRLSRLGQARTILLSGLAASGVMWGGLRIGRELRGTAPDALALPPGDTTYVFGPAQKSGTTAGATYIERFTAPALPGQIYTLRIVNGTASGANRVTQVTALVNGAQIVGPADLNSGTAQIAKIVAITAVDTLRLTVKGPAGSFVTASVFSLPDPTYNLFGPNQYAIPSGTSKTHTATFNRPTGAAPPYRVYVVNGAADGTKRVSNFTVNITSPGNSASVAGAGVGSIVKDIPLGAGTNNVSVQLSGPTQSFVTVRVTATDTTTPLLTITAPVPGTVTRNTSIAVTGTIRSPTSATVSVNGVAASISSNSYTATAPLSTEGSNTLTISAVSANGKRVDSTRTVLRDTETPNLTLSSPADGSATKNATTTITGTVIDATPVTVNTNGTPWTVGTGGVFGGSFPLNPGANVLTTTATDAAGNMTVIARTVARDATPPSLTVDTPADGSTVSTEEVTVSGTVTDITAVTLTLNGTGVTVGSGGAFSTSVPLTSGSNTITIVATDAATNATTVTRTVTREAGNLPPDPATVATANNPTVPTIMASSTSFLYSGANPIQSGVQAGAIQPVRAAVVRGKILSREGTPLTGVTVKVLNHPELGQTLSRGNGGYDLAVNGGGPVTLSFSGASLLEAQRTVEVPWQDFAVVDDVIMVALDPQATTIDFSQPIQAARGSVSSDEDGTRQATVLFEQGTTATAVLPDGSTQPLPSLTVRATEYTVGPKGPEAMPAELPPTSGYTYAVELSVDEARAMNASEVRFSRPVPFYLENFLGFDVGMKLPVGLYDRERATWVPSLDGRVIKVLSTTGGTANVDVTGSGSPASPAELDALGITNAELQQLASLYSAGKTLWRAALPHFTLADVNLSPSGPSDSKPPEEPKPEKKDKAPDDECGQTGASEVGCESQTLGERIPIVGTPHQLVYQSRRAPGRDAARTLDIPLSGGTVPASLKRIELTVDVGGKRTVQSFPATANQSTSFTWDGKDAYGRPVTGATSATVKVGYVYDAVYQVPAGMAASFGAPSGIRTTVPARQELTYNQTSATSIGVIGSPSLGVGGWSVAAHHVYDPKSQVLYLGTGKQMSADVVSTSTEVLAGTGDFGQSGDGGPARSATIGSPRGVLAGPDGSTYIVDRQNQRIRRVGPTGIISRYAGGGFTQAGTDPVVATDAQLFSPVAVALDAPGNLYIADQSSRQVYKVTPGGQLTVFAGTGSYGGNAAGDGGPATEAGFIEPFAIAVGPDQSVYIADVLDRRIRRVGPDGIISTFAGTGNTAVTGNGGPASAAGLGDVLGLSFGLDGSLYVSNYRDGSGQFEGVRRVGTDGIIRPIIGGGQQQPADGIQASEAFFSVPIGVWATADATVYFAEQVSARVWRVTPDGVLSRAAGTTSGGCYFSSNPGSSCGEGAPATQASLLTPVGATVDPAGRLIVAEHDGLVVRRFRPTLPGFSGNSLLVAAGDPGELYEFDQAGRHLRTLNGFTGATRYRFAYNSAGLLTGITDGDGATTTIERAANGDPTAIVGPDAQRTMLAVEPGGFLQRIEDPAGHAWTATYGSGGLVTKITDPNTHASEYTYGTFGRLTRTLDAEGGTKTPARTDQASGYNVGITSGLGVARSYSYEPLAGGASRRVGTDGAGLATTTTFSSDGSATTTTPDGTTVTGRQGPDPRFGMQAGVSQYSSIQLPSGLTATITGGRKTVLSNPSDPLSITSQIDSMVVNGRVFKVNWTSATGTMVARSPAGRTITRRLDGQDRPVEVSVQGLTPVTFDYDARGRPVRVVQGSRVSRLTYDAAGRVATYTDAMNQETQFFYDQSARLIRRVLPGNRTMLYGYDARGNPTTVTPPGRPAHQMGFNQVNLPTGYTPPALAGGGSNITNTFDTDRRLTQIARPDGVAISVSYDPAGRPLSITTPGGETRSSYNAATGQLTGLTAPGGISLAYTYDGALPTELAWSGPVSGSVGVTYNADAQVTTQRVSGGDAIDFGYDDDGLLTTAGALSLTRDQVTGLLMGTTLSSVTTARHYDGLAELTGLDAAKGASPLFHSSYTRDPLGRIVEAIETVEGSTVTIGYTYDVAGRLAEVRRNGTVAAVYGYDDNGNRITVTGPGISIAASYDAQDRLLSHGAATYTHTSAGERRTKTDASGTTTYSYEPFGNLTRVALPNGTEIEYLLDGQSRRVGMRVNGTLQRGWLYAGDLAPVAELNGSGQVVSRFVYGSNTRVPDYLLRDDQTYRIITDQLGSVRLVVNVSDGVVVQRLDYDPWGQVTQNTNPGFQPFGFGGGLFDEATELVRFGARDYDPVTGRWITKDPLGILGGGSNLYAYAFGDPVNFVDQGGQFAVPLVVVLPVVGGLINGTTSALQAFGCGQSVLSAFGRGFVGGALGTLAGIGAFELGAGAAVVGASAAFVGWLGENIWNGWGNLDPVDGAIQAGAGLVLGPAAGKIPGLKIKPGSFEPNLYKPRTIPEFGPNSVKLIGQEAAGGVAASAVGAATADCGCSE